ncbi:MAG: hypothetical protein ACXVXC_09755 [Nocardioidaceae bacterium]
MADASKSADESQTAAPAAHPTTPPASSDAAPAGSATNGSSATSTTSTTSPRPAPPAPARTEAAGRARKDREGGSKVKAGVNAVRSRIASLVWLVAVVCALFLAVGALMVALKMNQDNAIVSFVIDGAKKLDFGKFKEFTGKSAQVKGALVNWGIAAVIYLVVGRILDRLIRP